MIVTLRTVPAPVGVVVATVNVPGRPALIGVDGGVMTSVGAAETVTTTEPDACPDAAGVVVPPVPPVGGAWAPTLAVTVVCWLVVNVAVATPFASVVRAEEESEPAVDDRLTGAELSPLPLMSKTDTVIVVEPPSAGTDAGLALTLTRPTAADPMAILMAPAVPTLAPPQEAVMVAVPDEVPATNRTMTRPMMSVSASAG